MIFLNMPLINIYICIFLLIFSIAGSIVYTEEISLSSKWERIISLSFIFIVSLVLCLYIQIIFKWFVFMSMDWNRIINDLSARSTTLRYLGVLLFGMSGWSYLIQWYFSIIDYQFCYKNIAKTTTNFMLASSFSIFPICGFGKQVSNANLFFIWLIFFVVLFVCCQFSWIFYIGIFSRNIVQKITINLLLTAFCLSPFATMFYLGGFVWYSATQIH